MKNVSVLLGIIFLTGIIGCTGREPSGGVIRTVVGKAWIVSESGKREAKQNDRLEEGDAVETAEKSVVIAEILDGTVNIEIQQKAFFKLESIFGRNKTVAIQKGNLWIRVNKLLKGGTVRLKTPTSIAAVRGTKMYHFTMGDIDGICHCEGDVDYKTDTGGYSATHHRDHMVFVKGDSTVLLSPEDLAFMNTPGEPHRHSDLENSPLGPKASDLTPQQQGKLMKLIADKFAAAGKGGQ